MIITINSIYYIYIFVNGVIGCSAHKNIAKARLFYELNKHLIYLMITVYLISLMLVAILIKDYSYMYAYFTVQADQNFSKNNN